MWQGQSHCSRPMLGACWGTAHTAVSQSLRRVAGMAWLTCSHYASPICHPALQRIHAIEADGRVITDVEVFR